MSESKESKEVGIISISDFLQFLKVASAFNDSYEENGGKNFSYEQLAKNDLVNNLMRRYRVLERADSASKDSVEDFDASKRKDVKRRRSLQRNVLSLKSKLDLGEVGQKLNPNLVNKLDEVLNEGILDSFLPFICQSQSNPPKANGSIIPQMANQSNAPGPSSNSNLTKHKQTTGTQKQFHLQQPQQQLVLNMSSDKKTGSTMASDHGFKNIRRKSISPIVLESKDLEPELTIHVCDEVKNISRDFTCPQKLLISKMGYFADITNGQKLSEMDISVHCDLEIFDWLIKWVKRDNNKSPDTYPKLDPSNVVPILVSASFLQMEPLLLECLSFCHARLSEVIKISSNLACLNDSIITRLADLFTNSELENVKDKKDRIIPRLWTKLIQSLCEDPQALRGHYASLASLYRCVKCGKFLTQSASSYVHCTASNMKISRWGQIISNHVRDVNWSLSNYVSNLYKELRSWRKVYWRLWGMCHFLYCIACETHFPACQMQWCLFHPEPVGPNLDSKVGRYHCCSQLAYRYESITGVNGCQYKEHTVVPENDRDRSILNLVNIASDNNSMMFEAAPSKVPTIGCSTDSWWSGISILPSRSRQGILPALHIEDNRPHNRKFLARQSHSVMVDSSSETESSEYSKTTETIHHRSSSSDEGEESEYSSPPAQYKPSQKRRVRVGYGRNWSHEMSARSNQDNQREFEERAMKQIMSIVSKRTGLDQHLNSQYQQGGSYVKLENEWRENLKLRNPNPKNTKSNK